MTEIRESPEDSGGEQLVEHEYTANWPSILRSIGGSLLISTYQAGKVIALSAGLEHSTPSLRLSYHNFDRAMGIAHTPGRLAIGARSLVWMLKDAPRIAAQLSPEGERDACFLTRSALHTGEIRVHELAWGDGELWAVNTFFSCLCTLDEHHSFVPRWRPRFISEYAPEDRCHLNGMAMQDGTPRFVTVFGETDEADGWRAGRVTGGCLIDVASHEVVVRGLATPHSPRVHQGRPWLLDSGTGRLVVVDERNGTLDTVAVVPGYVRGLALHDSLAFVGLSKIRHHATFGGVPIAMSGTPCKCGVSVIDLTSGKLIAFLEFLSGIEEIFDIQILPGILSPVLSGPYPELDQQAPVWLAPAPPSF